MYERETCSTCHALDGVPADGLPKQVGPDLTHLASRQRIGSGVMVNNEANLALWMKNPQAIKEGCHMPNFQLSATDADALAAYLHGLK
ncbi:MAG: cytochrome c [Myxococcota bacterium]